LLKDSAKGETTRYDHPKFHDWISEYLN